MRSRRLRVELTAGRTNRPLALSLGQKRKAMIRCLDALNALKRILDELIAGVTCGRLPTR